MKNIVFACLLFCAVAGVVRADEDPQVFARVGDAVITQEMMDAAFSRIDDSLRLTFIRDGKRVDSMVKNMLAMRALANEAREAGYADDPLVQLRLQLAAEKELAEAWLDEQVRRAPAADFEQMAREYFQVNKDEFRAQPSWDLTHLLIGLEERDDEAALTLAQELQQKLTADPSQFDELVLMYSDDPSAEANKGQFKGVGRGDMVKPFEDALVALENPGDISEPVRTQYGYHIIRLDGKTPSRQQSFEEVKSKIIARFKRQHKNKQRVNFVEEAVSTATVEVPEGAVERMLKRYFGDDLEKAPSYVE